MKLFFTIFGTVMVAAVAAYAGGLADAIVETAPVIMTPEEPSGSVPSWVIPATIIAVLVGAAVLAGDDDDSGAS